MCDMVFETLIKVVISKVRYTNYTSSGCLGETWDDVIDAENNPFQTNKGVKSHYFEK